MFKIWTYFRYAVLLMAFIMLGFYLLVATPWQEWIFGPPTYAEVIAEGQPIVSAIYKFKADTGLWPQYLEDLVPHYLPKTPDYAWYYTVTVDGPSLAKTRSTEKTRTHVGFDFNPTTPSWRVFGDLENRTLKTLPPPPTTASAPSESRTNATLAEFDRRIKREPHVIDHSRNKVSFLRNLHRLADARAAAGDCLDNNPTDYWPRLAIAALDLESPATQSSTQSSVLSTLPSTEPSATSTAPSTQNADFMTQDFPTWVAANPTYTHYFYYFILLRDAHNDAAALDAISHMAALTPALDPDDDRILVFYIFDAARFALAHEKWDLVIALCDQWQKIEGEGHTGELSYYALRAAALLAKGGGSGGVSYDNALLDLNKLAATLYHTWAQNLPALRAAVKAKDSSYRYDPGQPPLTPAPYEIFATPQ